MHGFWTRTAAAALSCIAALLLSGHVADAADRFIDVSNPSVHRVFLPMSQSVTLQVSANLGDIVVGDEKIADAQPMTDRTLYVIGKSAGTTTVNLFSPDKRSLGVIQVEVGVDVSDMAQAIRQVALRARIEIGSINGKVRLGGHVKRWRDAGGHHGGGAAIWSRRHHQLRHCRRQPAGQSRSARAGSQTQRRS